MIFINKDERPPRALIKFIILQRVNSQPISYDYLKSDPCIKILDEILFKEQKGLCCYCMQKLSINSHQRTREHFLPQSQFKLEEVNYYNLYLSCTDKDRDLKVSGSKGTNTGHCDYSGTAKGDRLISKYIGHPNCETFFHYNLKGEILPKKINFVEWDKWNKKVDGGYTLELFKRNPETAEILATLYILNLNESELVKKRKKVIDELFSTTIPELTTKQRCAEEIQKYESFTSENPKPFAGLVLYFLNEHLNRI